MNTTSIQKGKGLIGAFSSILETTIDNNGRINVPSRFGRGYLQAFNFNPGLRMMVRDYELKGKIPIKKSGPNCFTESVILLFQNISLTGAERDKLLPSVQVFPEHIDVESLFPDITVSRSIAIAVKVAYLKELLKGDLANEILSAITQPGQTFLFEVLLPLSIEKVTNEILRADVPVALHNFYFKVKAEELICLLFSELLKRENNSVASLSIADMQTICKIRDSLLSQLNAPPDVSTLALKANWSKSKLTRLFKQIFGTGIFQYYQALRMQEAARLLKAKKLSVSEVGYEMGFTNLSHFTRTFEKHIGMKPKKYAQSG